MKNNKLYSAEEVRILAECFFYEGMTYEEFSYGKRQGGPMIPKHMSSSEYLYYKLKQKELLDE